MPQKDMTFANISMCEKCKEIFVEGKHYGDGAPRMRLDVHNENKKENNCRKWTSHIHDEYDNVNNPKNTDSNNARQEESDNNSSHDHNLPPPQNHNTY